MPDPTVGVFTASEALSNERIVGLSVTIPLGGEYRLQRALQALREAQAAQAAVERQRRDLNVEVAEAFAEATGSFERWQLASQGAAAAQNAAQLTQRAYALGEADLQTLLQSRRQALAAARSALDARMDALRWHARLVIDAHWVWGLADD